MPFHMAVGTLFAVKVREVVHVGEALDSSCPVLVRHAGLKQQGPCTFDNGAVRALDQPIGFGAVWIRLVVPDTDLSAHGM